MRSKTYQGDTTRICLNPTYISFICEGKMKNTADVGKKLRHFFSIYTRWSELKHTEKRTKLQDAEMEMLDHMIRNVK